MIPDDRQTGGRTHWTTLSVTLKGPATLNGKDQGQEQWVLPHLKWHNYKKGAKSSAHLVKVRRSRGKRTSLYRCCYHNLYFEYSFQTLSSVLNSKIQSSSVFSAIQLPLILKGVQNSPRAAAYSKPTPQRFDFNHCFSVSQCNVKQRGVSSSHCGPIKTTEN